MFVFYNCWFLLGCHDGDGMVCFWFTGFEGFFSLYSFPCVNLSPLFLFWALLSLQIPFIITQFGCLLDSIPILKGELLAIPYHALFSFQSLFLVLLSRSSLYYLLVPSMYLGLEGISFNGFLYNT